ncbi:hypothetical protein [Pedococcus sp. P5_B7]
MSHHTSIRRSASILGATGLIALSMAGPASARQVPGNGDWADQHCSTNCYEGGTTGGSQRTVPGPIDGSGVEVLQLGAGLLAGIALAGAGAAAFSRRSHGHLAHPA